MRTEVRQPYAALPRHRKRVVAMIDETATTGHPLDQRFSRRGALRSEWVYGRGYQGPGSQIIFDDLASRQELWAGIRVLEIGSGLGGDAFRLASSYGAQVFGVDMSPAMTRESLDRSAREGLTGTTFVTGDVRTFEFEKSTFDLVWTRDCLMYLTVEDKLIAWSRLFDALRPGGRILVTDYCRGAQRCSETFETFHDESYYNLATFEAYAQILASAGFADIVIEDRTDDLLGSMLAERARLVEQAAGFLDEFTESEHAEILDRWTRKIDLSERDELTWLLATARKLG